MRLIVGLGNPGPKYERTRHNLGFLFIDRLAERLNISVSRSQADAYVGKGRLGGEAVVLVKPQTFMNRSGLSVAQLERYWRDQLCEPPDSLIVAHDDMDLEAGRLKVASGGGPAGHKGIISIIERLGRRDFVRLKLGIGRPQNERMDVPDYVLSLFSQEEAGAIEVMLDRAVEAAVVLVSFGLTRAQNEFNRVLE